MIFNAENILLIGSILLFVSIVVSKTGYRFGIPTLLVFLLVGMLFGSDGLGLQFHDAGEAQFIGMMALHIPYPLVIGLLAAIVETIPLIGPIIGAIPPVLLGLLQGTTVMFQVIIFYVIVQQVDGHFVMPKLMGSIINVHPVSIIAGVLIGGKLFGVVGTIIAVPLVAVLQILLKHMWFYDRYKNVR